MNDQPWPAGNARQAAAVAAIGLHRLQEAVPADERGADASKFLALASQLQPLTHGADPESITDNLELLAGTTTVLATAEDITERLAQFASSSPRLLLDRVWGRLLPEFNIRWLDHQRVLLTGRTLNPRAKAGEAFRHAVGIAALAIGVQADSGEWAVIGKLGSQLTVVEGGRRSTTFRTYDTSSLLNPLAVLTDQTLAQQARISIPPFTKPGDVDRETLQGLGLDYGPMR